MPTGYESGKTWSPIGPQATVSDSAASRVWTINEVAAYEGAGTWPAPPKLTMEVISEGVLTSTATNIQIGSIPDIYTNLELITTSRTTNVYGPSSVRMIINNDTADNYGYNYGYYQISYNYSYAQGSSNNYYNTDSRAKCGYTSTEGNGNPAGYMAMSRIYIYNYSQATHGKNWTYISGTPGASNRNHGFQFGGGYYSGTAAISEIDFDAFGDTMVVGTTWQLNGYG